MVPRRAFASSPSFAPLFPPPLLGAACTETHPTPPPRVRSAATLPLQGRVTVFVTPPKQNHHRLACSQTRAELAVATLPWRGRVGEPRAHASSEPGWGDAFCAKLTGGKEERAGRVARDRAHTQFNLARADGLRRRARRGYRHRRGPRVWRRRWRDSG